MGAEPASCFELFGTQVFHFASHRLAFPRAVVGINPGQSKSCHSQAPCRIDGFAGNNLRSGDLMKILTACGTGQEVEGFPNNGTSLPATSSGSSFSWGVVDTVQAAVGTYKMCWCPFGNADGCSDTTHFVSEAGLLTIRGPQTLGFNATCVANQQPSCVVGPIEDGFGLSYGSDRVILVSSDGICGASAADPAVAGGAAGKQVGVDKFLQFSPEELPYGGSWKLCYCAGFDSPLDQEAQDCDFTATAGFLTVAGAFPGQVINCTRNEACEFNLPGYSLNAGVHKIAIRDESSGLGIARLLKTDDFLRLGQSERTIEGPLSLMLLAYTSFYMSTDSWAYLTALFSMLMSTSSVVKGPTGARKPE
eukprot:s3339_g1.t1